MRRRRGRGFQYLDENGRSIRNEEVIERIKSLAIPPAWEDVWICTYPFGHIQATGVDAAGRKQYRYHDHWRERRDREKFDSMIDFARALPRLRRRASRDLGRGDLSRERVLGGATRLLDRGFFRIGSEGYAEDNATYGLATIRKDHVTVRPAAVVFNDYVKDAAGGDFSAKDFRTWNATVLAAVGLAVSGEMASASKTARKRAARRTVDEVARYLGNTPAVCRASYIDPRVFDRFDGGLTIGGVLPELADADEWPAVQRSVEEGVLDLIAGDEESEAVERVA